MNGGLRRVRVLFCLLALLVVCGNPLMAQSDFDADRIDRFIQEQMQAQQIPGLALALTRGDEVLYVQGYGAGITPDTQFFIASITKSFTALAVMQLAEAGEIDLDAPVQTYLPEFTLADADAAARITVRYLLNQTSGMADTGFPESLLPQPFTLEERVSSLRDARLIAEPGTEFHYTNPNYQVLARLVEVVSGQPFADYLEEHIFTPLDMENTFSALRSEEAMARATQLAPAHMVVYGLPVSTPEMGGFLAGSGSMISTARDMANYLVMQNSGGAFKGEQLVSADAITLIHTPPAESPHYAMGWLPGEYDGVSTVEHNGILSVFYAEVVLIPETGHGIALLYNVNSLPSQLFAFPQVKRGLVDLLTGKAPEGGGITVIGYSIIMTVIMLLGLVLALRSMARLPRWRMRHVRTPMWRLLPGILWTCAPLMLLALLPQLTTMGSGRVFSWPQLFRFMPDVFVWLGLTSLLGAINGVARIVMLLRRQKTRQPI